MLPSAARWATSTLIELLPISMTAMGPGILQEVTEETERAKEFSVSSVTSCKT
jgi:hypothetical protein